MTVDPLCLQPATSIVFPKQYYAADIKVPHPQLRNFISTVYADKLFYAHRFDVFVIDLATQQKTLLVTVPFEAQCLAAAHGWVCAGGPTKGDCAFIQIGEHDGQPGNFCHELLVESLGKEIVNSMTIQLLKPEVQGYKDETVVLVSINDHTVTIYSLSQRIILATIEHPQPMNHAMLCPDTTIMAAVGDENKVYFMKRILDEEDPDVPPKTARYATYDWQPLAAPDVPRGSFAGDEADFSFSVAFSPDGRLCASSSQAGMITVFDMDAIVNDIVPSEDAIICSFKSSRDSLWGCVRSMSFSPAPWDLLAWAEDHGRIGLADVRQGFWRRQHLELTKHGLQKVDLEDASPAEWRTLDVKDRLHRQHQQRMQALRGHPPLGARTLSESRRHQTEPPDLNDLNPRERSILSSLNSTIDDIASPRGPFSINYNATQPNIRPSASRDYEVQLLNPSSRFAPSYMPRRRSSVVLSESQSGHHLIVDENTRMTMTASPGPMSDDGPPPPTVLARQPSPEVGHNRPSTARGAVRDHEGIPPMSTNNLTLGAGYSSSQPLPYNIPTSDPWHVIEASLATDRARRESNTRQQAGVLEIESAVFAERQLASRLERQLDDEQRLAAHLRSELEARERMLERRNREMMEEHPEDGEMSPSLERLLQRQLHSERDHGMRRSEELEAERQNMTRRVNQLMDERDALLQRQRTLQAHAQAAQSTALRPTYTHLDQNELVQRVHSMDEDRRQRTQRIHELELQMQRAESRVELASLQNSMEQNRASASALSRNRGADGASVESSLSRLLSMPTTPSAHTSTGLPGMNSDARQLMETFDQLSSLGQNAADQARRLRHRTLQAASASSNRATIPRISELSAAASAAVGPSPHASMLIPALIRIPDNDLRIARMMLARGTADGNGNWTPSAGPRSGMAAFPGSLRRDSGSETRADVRVSSIADIIRDGGIGTAGIGWSPDGLKLFAGTEQGIFEFELNVRDRMQSPLMEMR